MNAFAFKHDILDKYCLIFSSAETIVIRSFGMSRAERLAELRALRKAGKTAFSTYKVEEAEDVYDEVDEDVYKRKVRERLDRDDFVVDDNGAGYADDGREELDERHYESMTESEDEIPLKGKAGSFHCYLRLAAELKR